MPALERARQEMRSEGPALPYKGRGQAGENIEQRDKWLREGRDNRRARKGSTAGTSRTMFNNFKQLFHSMSVPIMASLTFC